MGLRSWGRLVDYDVAVHELGNRETAAAAFAKNPALPHGASRSYGDVAIANTLWKTTSLDRFIHFDPSTGVLEVESGVLLGQIQHTFASRGWMLAVTPGTQFVTVGGAIANDVHGKNHHSAGTFGEHVLGFTLARSDGEYNCTPAKNQELFKATIGGLGLTGLIVTAKIQLKKVAGPWIDAETLPFKNIDAFFKLSKESEEFEYTVAWFDCLAKSGRGIFTRGNHSTSTRTAKPLKAKSFPGTPPISLINRVTLPALNLGYYLLGKLTAGKKTMGFEPFFYPLDGIRNWNRAYGPKGFYQHQCVLPIETAPEALGELLAAIRKAGAGSLLAVLKTTAERKRPGLLTFPFEGVTLALDFPNAGPKTLKLLTELERIVVRHGGRLNPSKDATMTPESFAAGYPNFKEFLKLRDPKVSSLFLERITERNK